MDYNLIKENLHRNRFWVALVIIVLLMTGALLFMASRILLLTEDLTATKVALSRNTGVLSQNLSKLRSQTVGLSQTLTVTNSDITTVKNQVGGVQQTVGSISSTVSTLTKLAATDPELLKKYSKVYFLNENYAPPHLTTIPQSYIYSNSKPESFLTEAWPFLRNMLDTAKAQGVTLYIRSGYRSFIEQQALKSTYVITYGAGTANAFSADQGYSEHQLGTTVDLVTSGLGGELTEAFDSTPAFRWLTQNAHKFGFELSYPKNNAHYAYEPWHWRFVGVKLATYLHDQNKNFYDADQREIDAYLISIFD